MNYCVSHSIQMAMNIHHFQMFRNFFCNENNSLPKKDGFNQQRLEIQNLIRTCCLPSMVYPQDLWSSAEVGKCRSIEILPAKACTKESKHWNLAQTHRTILPQVPIWRKASDIGWWSRTLPQRLGTVICCDSGWSKRVRLGGAVGWFLTFIAVVTTTSWEICLAETDTSKSRVFFHRTTWLLL